jgi:hypothetical protein
MLFSQIFFDIDSLSKIVRNFTIRKLTSAKCTVHITKLPFPFGVKYIFLSLHKRSPPTPPHCSLLLSPVFSPNLLMEMSCEVFPDYIRGFSKYTPPTRNTFFLFIKNCIYIYTDTLYIDSCRVWNYRVFSSEFN